MLSNADRAQSVVPPDRLIVLAAPAPFERFSALLEHAGAIAEFPEDEPFALFLAMNYSEVQLGAVSKFVERCLRRGVFSIDVWGDGCETVHDIADETEISLQLHEPGVSPGTVVTTWHDARQVEDALWTFVNLAAAADGRREGRLWLVLLDENVDHRPIEAWFASSGVSVRRIGYR